MVRGEKENHERIPFTFLARITLQSISHKLYYCLKAIYGELQVALFSLLLSLLLHNGESQKTAEGEKRTKLNRTSSHP